MDSEMWSTRCTNKRDHGDVVPGRILSRDQKPRSVPQSERRLFFTRDGQLDFGGRIDLGTVPDFAGRYERLSLPVCGHTALATVHGGLALHGKSTRTRQWAELGGGRLHRPMICVACTFKAGGPSTGLQRKIDTLGRNQ